MKAYSSLILLVAALFSASLLPAQTVQSLDGIAVEYLATKGSSEMYSSASTCHLYFQDGISLYHIPGKNNEGSNVQQTTSNTGHITFNVSAKRVAEKFFFADRAADQMVAKLSIFDEAFIVSEPIPVINWRITDEAKSIAGYNCYKAVGMHRGRTYDAWFSPDLPLNAGPWKFSGLPGLILEVNEQEGQFNWYCKAIKRLSEAEADKIVLPKGGKKVSFDEYYDLAVAKIKEKFDKLAANPNITITSKFNTNNGLERTKK